MTEARIADAEARAAVARARLMGTIDQLADLLEPHKIARDLWESAKIKGADMAEDAIDAVKRRPVATGGIIAALAMFFAREPIKDGVKSLYGVMTSSGDDNPPDPPARKPAAKRPPAKKPATKKTRRAPRPARKTETK